MFEEIRDFFVFYVLPLLIIVSIIVGLVIICGFLIINTSTYKEHKRIEQEWQQKVNNCVLNEQCRPDCKLILYRDRQIHNQKVQDNQQASVMTGAMTGAIVGSMLGK